MRLKNLRTEKLKNRNFFVLLFIFFFAFILRFWKITEFPAGLNADEAAIGYNAYCLLETGKDEFGHPWPIAFQSFNDYKPGFYFYLVLPFVKFLGLSELAVRLPSVILGSLTVLILYFLVKKLFSNDLVALISSVLLSISPWHLHFSRGGWETNVATFLITTGVLLFLKSIKNPKFFVFCFLFFVLSLYTYHSARVVSPLLILGLILLNFKNIFKRKNFRWFFGASLAGIILIIPLVISFLGPGGVSRFSGVGLLADQGPYWRAVELRTQHQNPFGLGPVLLHNKFVEYGLRFFDNYLRHFNGDFLFISGDEIQRNRVPEMGQMYLVEIPFLILGLYFLVRNKPKNWQVVLWWLAVSPVASALTFQSPHAIRALNMVIPLVVLVAYGLMGVINWLSGFDSKKLVWGVGGLVLVGYLWSLCFYLHQYYIHYPQIYPASWEYGFKELVEYLKDRQQNYQKIYVTNKYDQPYILFAFYLKYPPEVFQKEAKLTPRDRFGFSTVENFGKYYFGKIDLGKIEKGGVLVVGSPEEIPDSATIIKRIYFKYGKKEAFRIIEN